MDDYTFLVPVALYFLSLLVVAFFMGRKGGKGDSDYFLAGRTIRFFPSLLSVVATETSVATIVIFPAVGGKSGYSLVWLLPGYIVGRFLVARFYLEKLYGGGSLSIYHTMTEGDPLVSRVLSGFYLAAKFISSGVRFFLGGYALSMLFGGDVALWMFLIALIVGVYSLTGGLRAVVVTDQIQGYIILLMGLFLIGRILLSVDFQPPPFPALLDRDFRLDNPLFFGALFLGGAILSVGTHAADQDMLQRVLAVKSLEEAKRSIALSAWGAAVVILLYLTVGYLLGGVVGSDLDRKSPLVDYVARQGGGWFTGLFAVLLFAAAMSTLDSAIHSTGAIWKTLLGSQRQGRIWSFLSLSFLYLFGLGFLWLEQYHKDFLSLAMGSMNYINGGLIGVITMFTFFPHRLRPAGILLALPGGFLVTLAASWWMAPPLAWSWTVLLSSAAALSLCWAGSFFPWRVRGKRA